MIFPAMTKTWLRAFLLIILILCTAAAYASGKQKDSDTEKKLAKQALEEANKLKFITDEKYVKRVDDIGQQIAAIARTTEVKASYGNSALADFTYSFQVVDDKDVNAFSLPAGYIFVNKGLIDRVDSDDELAGVLAHEIAHVAHHHLLALLRKQSKFDVGILAIIAAAAIGKVKGEDMTNIFYGAKLLEIAKVNSYSREAENDADDTAIEYLTRTNYNPVGVLTFMEKLARDQAYDPRDLGIFMNHPLSRDRVQNIIAELDKRNIPINRRAVSSMAEAIVQDTVIKGENISEVVIEKTVIFRPADLPEMSSANRAKALAEIINQHFQQNPQPHDVRLDGSGMGVYMGQDLVIDVSQSDADLVGLSREALALKAKESIQAALVDEFIIKMLY